jgi:hypothetical protein
MAVKNATALMGGDRNAAALLCYDIIGAVERGGSCAHLFWLPLAS